MKLTLDLHDIYNQGSEIEKALQRIFDEAIAKKAPMIEIIPGKGSGQLKKHVLRFFDKKRSSVKNMRIEKPSKNFGTVKVHFNWNEAGRR
jgi:dsDNA-specific endonuclease/ATPase MutS2